MSKRNKSVGSQWERDSANLLRPVFPDACTSRSESRNRDNEKVDLCKTGFLNVQNKCFSKIIKYDDVLDEMPVEKGQMNVIFDRQTRKAANGRFMKKGEYVHMHLEDFIKLMTILYENNANINTASVSTISTGSSNNGK